MRVPLMTLVLMLALTPIVGSGQDDNEAAETVLPNAEAFGDSRTLLLTDFPEERALGFALRPVRRMAVQPERASFWTYRSLLKAYPLYVAHGSK